MLANKRKLSVKSKPNSKLSNRDRPNNRDKSNSRKSSRKEKLLRLNVVRLKNKTDFRCSRSLINRRALTYSKIVSNRRPMLREMPAIKQLMLLPKLSRTPLFTTE